jgi:hypothetical protein
MRPPQKTGWRELAAQAVEALARLDADRLEEMASSCSVLQRQLADAAPARPLASRLQPGNFAPELALLRGVLEATRVNLSVLRCAGAVSSPLEYIQTGAQACSIREGHCGHN